MRRDADELEGFLEFLVGEISHRELATAAAGILLAGEVPPLLRALPAAGADGHHGYAGGLLEHTVGVATLCRETAQLHPRLRHDLLLGAAFSTTWGARSSSAEGHRSARRKRAASSGTSTSA